ncbi:Hypothetical protein R9X50_00273800 [Acrodontium crateriforme]|uniref:Uncharacterized protein n=1 Tax=Acrodontium crateriforme TaxID=150365 RepID=A0AAQ3M4F8_9PEZI|nr:Hypothetical protein R9X50_00273800 [Acrodontium crateriforme]
MSAINFWWKSVSTGSMFGRTGTGPRPTDDLTIPTRDDLFDLQIRSDDFTRLTAESLRVAKIVETKQYANSVLRGCIRCGVINAETGQPDTTKINRDMVNKIAIISVPKQRELVNMLFFWEEEMMRWRLLSREEDDLTSQLSNSTLSANALVHAKENLQIVQAKKRVPPSRRDDSGRSFEELLPGYERKKITAAIPSVDQGQTYVFVTNCDVEGTLDDTKVLFGPAVLEVNPPAPEINYSVLKE